MNATVERAMGRLCFLSAIILALSFVLPLSQHATYLDADGRPAGLLGQLFPDPDSARVVDYEYFWQDLHGVTLLVFFLPLTLIVMRRWRGARFRSALSLAAPLIAVWLLAPLVVMFQFADFALFPGTGSERALGSYVALASLVGFLITSGVLAAATLLRVLRSGPNRVGPRRRPTLVCG